MRARDSPISTPIVVGIGRGLLLKHKKTSSDHSGDSIELSRVWARSVLRRMGFSKRRASSTSKVLPHDFMELKKQFLIDIAKICSKI